MIYHIYFLEGFFLSSSFYLFFIIFTHTKKTSVFFFTNSFLCCFLIYFSFVFFQLSMKESMIFVYISANCIQHEFFIHFFFLAVVELSELFVFFYIPKMSFCLDRPGLTVDDPFSALDIYMRFCLQFLPSFIDLHYFVFVLVLIRIVFIKTFFFVFTSSAVCTSVHLKCLAVSLLLSLFCPDMMKLPSVAADIILLSF